MLKKLPVFIILFTLLFSVFTQVKSVTAFHNPITSPVTSPVTSPITSAKLIGKVVHKQLGRLFGNAQRIVPVEGVEVIAKNLFNKNQKFETTTDSSGNYSLNVSQGLYIVEVDDAQNTLYAPPLKVVNIKTSVKRADFQGLLFPSFRR